jgi:hypothetical protein
LNPIFGWLDAFGSLRPQFDPSLFQHWSKVDFDFCRLSPADGDPWIRRHERIGRAEIDDGETVIAFQLGLHLIGHDGSTKARAENDNVRHGLFLRLSANFP